MATIEAASPSRIPAKQASIAVLVLAALAIGGAWFSQLVLGLAPCELCLLQRWPYYIGVPIAAVTTALALRSGSTRLVASLLSTLALIFLVSAGLAAYHAGVEWGFWPGPSGCTGQYVAPASTDDFLKSLDAASSVRCDEAAVRFLGLSLAGWNVLASLVIAGIAGLGAKGAGPRKPGTAHALGANHSG
ncbi:MAG: disulfide bond formation protein B [Hyphomicrobiales bacterium]|nr:disulfide bond formation protein B [Hyphomicrobiales bacterium]